LLAGISILVLIAFSLGSCTIERTNGGAGDVSFVPAVSAQTDTVVSVQPPARQVDVGAPTVVEIRVDNVANLYGAEIQVQFDPNFVQVLDTSPNVPGNQIEPGDFLSPDLIGSNQADNTTGNISYAVTQVAPTPAANGSGSLAVITFQARAIGVSQLTFNVLKLSDPNGQALPAIAQAGQIVVVPDGDVTATFTPSPSPTSTFTPGPPTETFTPEPPTATPLPPTATSTPGPPATATPHRPSDPSHKPPMAHIPKGATLGFCYRVQLGETIYDVAKMFRTSPDAINLVNDLHPPYIILAYQALFIPHKKGHGPNVYIVREGDTLESIADRCKLTASMIAKANNLLPSPLELSVTPMAARQSPTLEVGLPLIIPIPPFPPPSRYPYPLPIIKIPAPSCCGEAPSAKPGQPQYP
jgi:LysM repeat protein